MNNTEIGKNIRAYRKMAKMTQQELADKLFVSQVTIQQWEKGVKLPQADKLTDIAKIFHISIDQIYYNDSEFRYFMSDFNGIHEISNSLRSKIIEKKKKNIPLNQIEKTYCKIYIDLKYNPKEVYNEIKQKLYNSGKIVMDEPLIATVSFLYSLPITEYDLYLIKQNPHASTQIAYRHRYVKL